MPSDFHFGAAEAFLHVDPEQLEKVAHLIEPRGNGDETPIPEEEPLATPKAEDTEAEEILPAPTLKTVVRVLTTNPAFRDIVFYDDFLWRAMTGQPAREWADSDDFELTIKLQALPGLWKIGTEIVRQAAMTIAFRNRRNCVKDWLESLTWDRVSRVEHFFEDHLNAEGTPYTRAASRNFWISMAARVFRPGCQVDNMVVLEGSQGIRKSSALRVIGGDWFTEQHESATGKGFFEVLQGKLLVEISEMDSFSRAEVTKVKQIITCTNDRFRESYGRHAKDHPRQCVFVGSTNRDDWNSDVTGARRFWPIACRGDIDVEAIRRVRNQCFAEAVHLFKAGATWWEMPAEETKTQQDSRYVPPAWVDPLQRYIDNERVGESSQWVPRVEPLTEVSVGELMEHALKMPEAQWTKPNQMQVAESLRALGWKRATKRRNGGKPVKVWLSPPVTT